MNVAVEKIQGVCVVELGGNVDFESADCLNTKMLDFIENKKVVFNLEKLSFVGSCGVLTFLEAMVKIAQNHKLEAKFCGVGGEFLQLFQNSGLNTMQLYPNAKQAVESFNTQKFLSQVEELFLKD